VLTCEDLHKNLDAFLDGRLDRERRSALEAHLAQCNECNAHLKNARAVERRLRERYYEEPMPAELWSRIQASLSMDRRGSSRNRGAWTAVAIAASLVLAVGAALMLSVSHRAPSDELSTAIVNELRTFVISRRSVDLASTDPLALRGWFVDKVEFSPPSPPSAGGALDLVGGRLCNILDQRVISYMYRSQGRLVSLYVMRDRGRDDGGGNGDARTSEMNGYTHVGWTRAGLRYSLVAKIPAARAEDITRALMQEMDGREVRRG